MNIRVTGDLAEFVHQQVASGRYSTPAEVIHAALRYLCEQEQEKREELRQGMAVGIAEADEGKVAPLNARETLNRIRMKRNES
jgi:putative addiction module CopG family antidote